MAGDLGLTKQNFNSHWTSARIQLIQDYIEYNKLHISQFIKH